MKKEVEKWVEESGERILRYIGISEGQTVLDFGCGCGNYTIPAARIVGEQGLVYALDEDKSVVERLMNRVKVAGLKNVIKLDAPTRFDTDLDDESVDVVLLYDILHYYYFPQKRDRQQLLREMYRILKPNAILSLYPAHLRSRMEPKLGEVKREIEEAKFREEGEYPGVTMAHDDKIEEGLIINFRKEKAVG